MISSDDGRRLLALARKTIENSLYRLGDASDEDLKSRYSQKQGVFVTITRFGELRGCIGFPEPIYPLYDAIILAAKHAAFEDPRFPPLSANEIEDIRCEISVLTVPEEIAPPFPDKVRVGEDGLIIRGKGRSGLLLPQVAVSYRWSPQEFLSYTCEKAGLPKDFWQNDGCRVFRFQAQIFHDEI